MGIGFTCPPGRVASTVEPTRVQSHIDVFCEHELMDFHDMQTPSFLFSHAQIAKILATDFVVSLHSG